MTTQDRDPHDHRFATAPAAAAAGLREARLFVAGTETVLGQALVRELEAMDGVSLCGRDVTPGVLRDFESAADTIARLAPTHVIVTAGRSGGIALNRQAPADLMLDNLRVVSAVIPAAHARGVSRLLYVASSCVYPRVTSQPMAVDAIMTGPLEPTSQAYAIARLAGLTLCQAYRDQHDARFSAAVAGDAYGPGDEFDPEHSHVVAGMIRRMHEARERGDREFVVWGSGRQVRDLIYVDDLARACLLALAAHDAREPINLSAGSGVAIGDLATVIREVVGYDGALVFDTSKPDGAPVKVLDAQPLAALGFTPLVSLRDGIARTYAAFLSRHESMAER